MNRNFFIIACVLIVAVTAYSFLSLGRLVNSNKGQPDNVRSQPATLTGDPAPVSDEVEEQKRRAAMRAGYDRLEQARDRVRKQLGILKSRLWQRRVPPDRASVIREQMLQGHASLKNPPLLGAFSSLDEIDREIAKMNGVGDRLKTLETEILEFPVDQQSR